MFGMEHVPKEFSLDLPLRAIKVYLAAISLALKYLHSRKIVYCDLKHENILIGDNNHIRLIDFGLD
jgi:serine/threonine protein kinase